MNIWDERFATPDYVFGRAPCAFLQRQTVRLVAGQTALALADGEGRNGVFLAQNGLKVVSMDSSAIASKKAQKLAADAGVTIETEVADIATWPWPDAAFDLVAGIFMQFMGPELRAAVFSGMKRTVKPGGVILLHGYTPKQLEFKTGGPGVLENLYTEDMLQQAFGDFEILELNAYEAELTEGRGHKGPSALIDLVARRPA